MAVDSASLDWFFRSVNMMENTISFKDMFLFRDNDEKYHLYYNYFKWPLVDLVTRLYFNWINSEEYDRILLFNNIQDIHELPINAELKDLGIQKVYVLGTIIKEEYEFKMCNLWVVLNTLKFLGQSYYWVDKIKEVTSKYEIEEHFLDSLEFSVDYSFEKTELRFEGVPVHNPTLDSETLYRMSLDDVNNEFLESFIYEALIDTLTY